ncbi:MAG: histone deacetylase [Armatimonadetes bacterium]|nr:histone deacetylase [Armatimonadota bacterium]
MASVLLVASDTYLRHQTPPDHPERPERLTAVREAIDESGLREALSEPAEVAPVDLDLLRAVHRPEYVRQVEQMAAAGGGMVDPDTFVGAESYEVALQAAGGAVAAVTAVAEGRAESAFALVRPPGHHALPDRGMGFCLFNNAALAAVAARDRFGLRRILLLDWDVHHGNGTQAIFWRDPTVLYVSTHQENWYPGTGAWDEVGEGEGEGFTLNIPLPPETGDEGYRLVFEEVVVPLAGAFLPDLLLVSAGYDAHFADPLSGMLVSAAGFRTLTELAVDAARRGTGRLVAVLEGGYDLPGLATSVVATLEVLTRRTARTAFPDHRFEEAPYPVIRERIRRARRTALNYWRI